MDWSRAKNILLIVLVLLNLFLFFNVLNVRESLDIAGSSRKEIKQALETAGIVVMGNIPSYNRPVARICFIEDGTENKRSMIGKLIGIQDERATKSITAGSVWKNSGQTLHFEADFFIYTDEDRKTVIPSDDDKKLEQRLLSWIRESGISREKFFLDTLVREGENLTAVCVQVYKNMPIFSNKIIFTLEGNLLKKVQGSMKIFDAIKLSTAEAQVVPADIVLLGGKEKVQGVVHSISLGYLRLDDEDLYETPVWRVTIASGEKLWFNAYTGEWLDYR